MRHAPSALLLGFTCVCAAQGPGAAGPGDTVRFTASANIRSISLRIPTAPAKGDFFTIVTSTRHISAVLVLPGGQRVSVRTAKPAGFQWTQGLNTDPSLGASTDPGDSITITFENRAIPGTYTVILTAANAPGATARASFTSRMRQYTEVMRSAANARTPPPVALRAQADLILDVEEAETGVFDIVVPDPAVLVSLTLPDGRILRRADEIPGMRWGVSGRSGEIPPEAGLLEPFHLFLPIEGFHHVIMSATHRGKYKIHAESNGARPGQLRASYFSLEDPGIVAALRRTLSPEEPAPGQVHIQARPVSKPAFPGRDVELAIGLAGDIGSGPLDFKVRLEMLPAGTGAYQGPLGVAGPVSDIPVTFTHATDGDYHAAVPVPKVGTARIEVRVSGKNSAGQPFQDQTIFNIQVDPIIARITSLDAKAVDLNNDGIFDRLDVTAQLEVDVPGEYLLDAEAVSDSGRANIGGIARLALGRQSLTASINGPKIWILLGAGPYEIRVGSIFMKREYSFVSVPDSERTLHTPAYRLNQWARGSIYGDDHVTVRGVRPTASGRFRAAEIVWEVTTPGGRCEWSAQAFPIGGVSGVNPSNVGELAPGRSKLSFIIDGASIAASRSEWKFDAHATCGRGTDRAEFPARTLIINPAQYVPGPPTLRMEGDNQLRWVSGRSWSADLFAFAKPGPAPPLEIIEAPEGIDARLAPPSRGGRVEAELKVTVPTQVPAGRYFIVVAARWGQEVLTRDLVLDIPPAITGR